MSKVWVTNTRSGDRVEILPFSSFKWEKTLGTAETLSTVVNYSNPGAAALDLDSAATPLKFSLAIIEGERVPAAGVIWPHEYAKNDEQLTISAKGIMSLLYKRILAPVSVLTTPVLIQDGDDAGKPNPAVATSFTGKSWPYIVRKVLQQMMAWPGGELPLVFGPDGVGSHDKTWDASQFKSIGEAFDDLQDLVDGPEIDFFPRIRADGKGIEILVLVGDDDDLRIRTDANPKWDYTVPEKGIEDLDITVDATGMASASWATGGKPAAVALVAHAYSSDLIDAGYPHTDVVDTSHSDVTEQATLDSYSQANLALGQKPVKYWPFAVRNDQSPFLTDYWVGDTATVKVLGDPYTGDGKYDRRIMMLSGDEQKWVKVTTGGVYE